MHDPIKVVSDFNESGDGRGEFFSTQSSFWEKGDGETEGWPEGRAERERTSQRCSPGWATGA